MLDWASAWMKNLATPASDSSVGDVAVRTFAHEHFVGIFIGANKRSQVGLLLSATLLAFLWSSSGSVGPAGIWGVLVLGYTAWRFRFSDGLVKERTEKQSALRILWLLGLSGVVLAVPLWWFDEFTEVQRAAITIIMCSTAAASVSTTA